MALFKGASEIRRIPSNGVSSSMIRNMALETDNAQTTITAYTVPFRGAKRLKLPKIAANQNASTIRNGSGIELPF